MPDAFALAGVLPPNDPALANVGRCCSADEIPPPLVAHGPGELPYADFFRDVIADFVARSGRPDLIVWVDGWETRGRPYDANYRGVIDHHTADRGYSSDYPALGIVRDGRSDLPGPLAQLGIGRLDLDGWARVYVISAGFSNHAGGGGWDGLTGNGSVIGIEWASDGIGEDVGEHHRRTYRLLNACLLRGLGVSASRLCQHREWSDGGKIDATGFDGDEERAAVQALLDGANPSHPDPPEEDDLPGPVIHTIELARGEQSAEIPLPAPAGGGLGTYGIVHGSFSVGNFPSDKVHRVGLVIVKHRHDGSGVGVPEQDPSGVVYVKCGSGRYGHFDVEPGEESLEVKLADVDSNPAFATVRLLLEIGTPK